MALLIVKLHGEEVTRLVLENGTEYIAGRAQDAQIQLAGERGISRHHLKFYEKDGVWVCQTLGKFTLIHRGENSVEILELSESCAFSVPPYEFVFQLAPPQPVEQPAAESPQPQKVPAFYQPKISAVTSSEEEPSENTSPRANNEATMAGVPAKLVPYIRISYPNTADDEILKLEGHLWVAGRDSNSEIPIDSPHISRKHFELVRTNEGFFITDLGSSNGTKLNGARIPPHEPTRLNSGDDLQIKNVTLVFEIRDANFNQRVEALAAPAFNPMFPGGSGANGGLPMAYLPPGSENPTEMQSSPYDESNGYTYLTRRLKKAAGSKKILVRGALVIAIVLAGLLSLFPDKAAQNAPRDPAAQGNTSVSFEKLTNEQRSVVKDSFNLARNLYVQGKYALCLTELAKVHELIPIYENSKELESFCKQGQELVRIAADNQRLENERREIEMKITAIVENCRQTLKAQGSVDETRLCLADAMQLNPEHHLIVEMIHTAQARQDQIKLDLAQRKDLDAKAQRGYEAFKRAEDVHKKGQLAKAIKEYEQFLNSTFPRAAENKEKARRAIASIRSELKTKVSTLMDQCKAFGEKGQFRDAYLACDKAVDEDPANEPAKTKRSQMMSSLKRELSSVYADSTIEESLGNVESAKEKWKKIEKEDLPDGEYAKKARYKLEQYRMSP